MDQISPPNVQTYSTAGTWEIALFFLVLAFYLSFLLWAIYTRRNDDIDSAIRSSFKGHVDPDDLSEALAFERKQARTGAAIRGEK